MSQSSIERLRNYLGQLPPKAQALLMREFERAIERGEDVAVANFVLEQLRMIVRAPSEDISPRTDDPMRLVFRPLEPFLVENIPHIRPGQIRRSSLAPVWMWFGREGNPEAAQTFEAALARATVTAEINAAVRAVQAAVSDAIANVTGALSAGDRQRTLGRLGAPSVVETSGRSARCWPSAKLSTNSATS